MEEKLLINALQHFNGYKGSYSFKDKLPLNLNVDEFILLNTDKTKKQLGEHWLILRKIKNNGYEQIDSDYLPSIKKELLLLLPNNVHLISPSFSWQNPISFACGEFCLTVLFLIRFHQYHSPSLKKMKDIEHLYFKENQHKRNETLCKHIVYNYILINNNPPNKSEINQWIRKM